MGKISQALNYHPKGALPSSMVVNPKGGNNMGYAMDVTTRNGRGGNAPTSSQRQLVDDEQVVQEEVIPSTEVQPNDKVGIDIDDSVEETQEEVSPSRDHIIDIPESVMQKAKTPLPKAPPSYPQRFAQQNGEYQLKKFIQMMNNLSINMPLVKALEKMPGYAKFMKDLVQKKRSMNFETIKVTHQVSAIVHSMDPKLEDPSAFMIPCTIGSPKFAKTLCDLGASINLIPYSVFKTLGIGQLRPTSMRLQMANRTMKRPLGVIEDVLVCVDKFILSADSVILDCEVDYEVPIILGKPFLATGKALCGVEAGELTLAVPHKRKKDIGWTLADIRGISPAFCMDKIKLEIILDEFSSNQRQKLKRDCQDYYWDEPYLFPICMDGVIRICVPEEEQYGILGACQSFPYGGHHGGIRTASKVLSCDFYWPTLYKDVSELEKRCDKCQRAGGISKKNDMPITTILEIDIFDVLGIEFMGPL
ncbi:uncharacterized protein [Nicotiana tomentosiformis]|uniref:uncharacterized protein n=1 Tax=Nicotiana tomentosiformis TaxID=4098 RepID=UPI00388CA475